METAHRSTTKRHRRSSNPFLLFSILPLLAGALIGCPSQSQGGDTEAAVLSSGARFADTLAAGDLPPRGSAWVLFGSDTVVAEVAATPSEREEGLMYRRELADGTGMLFVFQDERERSFWMRNTYVPLDIAFLDASMQVIEIEQMEPETEEYHTSDAPAMFALEVSRGWFETRGIGRGDQAEIVFGPR